MKKKTLLTFLMISLSACGFAQLNQGAVLLEGNVSFSTSKTDDEFFPESDQSSTYFNFNPKIGLMAGNNTLIGIGLTYDFNKYEYSSIGPGDPYTVTNKSNLVGINPYVRKYLGLNDKLFFMLTGNAFVGFGNLKSGGDSDMEAKTFVWRLSATPGLTYVASERWAVTASLGQIYYGFEKVTYDTGAGGSEDPENKTNSFGASFQFNTFGIGVQYFLRN